MTTCARHLHVKFAVAPSSMAKEDTYRAGPSVDFWDFSLRKWFL